MVLEVADYDHDRAVAMLGWPVRHLLLAAVAAATKAARETYQLELLVWSSLAPHAAKKLPTPEPPAILKDIIRGDA